MANARNDFFLEIQLAHTNTLDQAEGLRLLRMPGDGDRLYHTMHTLLAKEGICEATVAEICAAIIQELQDHSPKKTEGFAPKGARQVRLPFFLHKGSVTVVGWETADGVCGPLPFVLPSSVLWTGDLTSQQIGELRVAGTDNEWVHKETFFVWLKQVFQPTTKCSPENPFLLFMDSHSTRYNTENIGLDNKSACHIIVIPSDATHFMGVTDKTCHGPYHVRYSKYKNYRLKDDIIRPLCCHGNSVLL